jgi:hypothetical protein
MGVHNSLQGNISYETRRYVFCFREEVQTLVRQVFTERAADSYYAKVDVVNYSS